MNINTISKAGLIGGIWLLGMNFIAEFLTGFIAPYDIFKIGGMRPPDDPIMWIFFLSPFVFAFLAAVVYDLVKGSFTGSSLQKGVTYGGILIALVLVPSIFIIFSSMTYPAGFYISNILFAIIGYPVLGIFFAIIWEKNRNSLNIG